MPESQLLQTVKRDSVWTIRFFSLSLQNQLVITGTLINVPIFSDLGTSLKSFTFINSLKIKHAQFCVNLLQGSTVLRECHNNAISHNEWSKTFSIEVR